MTKKKTKEHNNKDLAFVKILKLIEQIDDVKLLEAISGIALIRIDAINYRNHVLNNNLASNYDTTRIREGGGKHESKEK